MLHVAVISGSPSAASRSRRLAEYALSRFREAGATTSAIDLCDLPADALLGRTRPQQIVEALQQVAEAQIVVASTPVYRAAYSGLLKVFFDLLPQEALSGKVALPIATGASPAHQLAIDHALRPLFASVGAVVVSSGVYATDGEFGPDGPSEHVLKRVTRAADEALALSSRR